MPAAKDRVRVAGRELTLTNLDKVIYPETGTTKADVLAYYAAVAHDERAVHAVERAASEGFIAVHDAAADAD